MCTGALHAQGQRNYEQGKQNAACAVALADPLQQLNDVTQKLNSKKSSQAFNNAVLDNPQSKHSSASNQCLSATSSMHMFPEPCESGVMSAPLDLVPSSVANNGKSSKSIRDINTTLPPDALSAQGAVKDSVIGLLQELDEFKHGYEDLYSNRHSSAQSVRPSNQARIGNLKQQIHILTDMVKMTMQDAMGAGMQQQRSILVNNNTMVRLLS